MKKPKPTRDELIDALIDMVDQHCSTPAATLEDPAILHHLDSCAISANHHAMSVLAREGVIEIDEEHGRRSLAHWLPYPAELEVAQILADPARRHHPKCDYLDIEGAECDCGADDG